MDVSRIIKESWVVLLVLAGAVAASVLLVYIPQSRKHDELRGAIVLQELELVTESAKAGVVPKLLTQVNSMKKRYKDFDRRLPRKQELAMFNLAILFRPQPQANKNMEIL